MKVKIGLLLWLCVCACGCTRQDAKDVSLIEAPMEGFDKKDATVKEPSLIEGSTDEHDKKDVVINEFSLIKDPTGLGFSESGKNTYEFILDDSVSGFDDLARYKITNPRFKDEFIASENAKFPFDETYKKKILEAFHKICNSDNYIFLSAVGLDRAKKMTKLLSYDIETKEPVFFDFSDIEKYYSSTEVVNIEFYARENPNIIDGILYTLSGVVYNYDDEQLYAETRVRYLDIEYDEQARIKALHNDKNSFVFNYLSEDVFEFTEKNDNMDPDKLISWTFNTKTHEYKINDNTYPYMSIEPNEQYFTEEETPYAMFYYNGKLYNYDDLGRLNIFADCVYDTPGKKILHGLDWSNIYLIAY